MKKFDKSYILVCLLSIWKYDARMIMYARALYRSFKVRWIGKVYFPTHVLFTNNTVIRGEHDNVPTCVYSSFKVYLTALFYALKS